MLSSKLVNNEIVSLLSNYSEILKEGIGKFKDFKARGYLKDNVKSKFFKPRTVPYALASRVNQEIDRLEKLGLIEPVETSDWATPIVPIVKPGGSIRICGYFKMTINQALEDNDYSLPRLEDIFAKLSDGKVFSKIDLSNAYLHMAGIRKVLEGLGKLENPTMRPIKAWPPVKRPRPPVNQTTPPLNTRVLGELSCWVPACRRGFGCLELFTSCLI
ncbi:hypothetical protein JTE90_018166 [Oedothorax gibbosus]|uniref:Reverse transcriptase domain-containing protein n=1 Tax=Oedothorax gibbosus TaxID=931172 RepID=A0AAV6U976_9ARAC|nr:hypothetical protein JTE90_018166 [Oedothorax gibbosus]